MLEHLNTHEEYPSRDNAKINHNWTCQFCNQSFKSRRILYEHNKTCEERLKCECDSIGRIKNPIAEINRLKSYQDNRKKEIKINRQPMTEEHKKAISEGTKISGSPYSNICDNAERNRENETCRDYNQPPKFKRIW